MKRKIIKNEDLITEIDMIILNITILMISEHVEVVVGNIEVLDLGIKLTIIKINH